MATDYDPVVDELRAVLGADVVSTAWPDRLAAAHDASLYRIVPNIVVRPRSTSHVVELLSWCRRHGRHCTFRAAATSLSGQAVGSDVIVDISRGWNQVEVLDHGTRVRCEPGARGGYVNARLRATGSKLGPDPASIQACMVGGIVANNASGMCCGTQHNSYHTIDSIAYILASGTCVDTAVADCDAQLRAAEPVLYAQLAQLRDDVRSNPALVDRIRSKYRIKNTMGYSLNAFLDEDEPARILGRLMVGSEGTLGFIESVTYRTIPDAQRKWTSIILYSTIAEACAQVTHWAQQGAAAIELMDEASLTSIASLPHTPPLLARPPRKGATAVLVEFHDVEPSANVGDHEWTGWTTDPVEQARLWAVRKGLMPSIGALRPPGTTMINEDIAVPPHHLAGLVADVQQAFRDHGYNQAIIFGHAKDGNMHFVLNHRFATPEDIDGYDAFMRTIADIVVGRYDGSLKAEHGTGRNMAPFVEREWGAEAYAIMQRLKRMVDPTGVLNPGVLLNDNPRVHVENIKPVPTVDAEVDACIECGFCEHVCPSRDVTLTPRQRIVLRRERALNVHQPDVVRAIDAAYGYAGLDTCATDGLCAVACPVGIDTGALVRRLRGEGTWGISRTVAAWLARHYGVVDGFMRWVLRIGRLTGWTGPTGPTGRTDPTDPTDPTGPTVIPSCVSRWLSATPQNEGGLAAMFAELMRRAELPYTVPAEASQMCCGQIFESKGYHDAAVAVRTATREAVVACGHSPAVLFDTPTCGLAMRRDGGMPTLDMVTYLHDVVMPRLRLTKVRRHVVVHPGCGTRKAGNVDQLLAIAAACSERVSVPPSSMCCGYAGDRGMRFPELPSAAIGPMAVEVAELVDTDGWYGFNTTCEMGLRTHTGQHWASILELLLEASQANKQPDEPVHGSVL